MRKKIFALFAFGFINLSCMTTNCMAAVTENFAIDQINDALTYGNEDFDFTYGSYSSESEAEKACVNVSKAVDSPLKFLNGNFYLQNTIVPNGNTYTVSCSIKKYRNIDDVDWSSLAASFHLENATNLKKIIWVHEWICDQLSYSLGTDRTLASCLTGKKAKCDEYAMIYSNLLNELGVESRCVDGVIPGTNEGHMWNLVKLDGKWYYCDITEDDNTGTYDYFLKGSEDEIFLDNHSMFMSGDRLCNGVADFSGYKISKTNYFEYMEMSEDKDVDLYNLEDVTKKIAKKASAYVVSLKSSYCKRKGSVIRTKGHSGVIYGKIKAADGLLHNYLIQKY